MRLIKALSALTVVAICAMAFAGAGPAFAETLCKAKPVSNECTVGNRFGIPTTIKAQTGETLFNAGFFSVKCISKIKIESVENLGAGKGLKGKLTELSLVTCTNCMTATAEHLPFKTVMTSLPGETGDVALLQWEALGIPIVKLTGCFGGLTCIYGAASTSLTFKASPSATKAAFIEIGASQTLQRQEGSNEMCAGTAKWEKANYEISDPLPLWLAANP